MVSRTLAVSALGALLVAAAGCGDRPTSTVVPAKATGADEHEHEHGAGPHGGTVFDWGNYHAEFDVKHDRKEAILYLLKGNLKKTTIPIDKLLLTIKEPSFQVEMKASPQDGDPAGRSSRFVAVDARFGEEREFEGTLTGTVEGDEIKSDFKELPEKK